MSAITGIYHVNGEPVPHEHGNRMMKELQKFPADDVQTWYKDNVFLGCHAQWITPESIGELLPYYDPERRVAITADAIIDNREELFEKLQVKPTDQKLITDSELILLSYLKWGEDSPKFLVGDFAFMIWDEREQKMFGARDFSGTRTLYYFWDNNRFAFSTTMKPLLSLPYIEKQLNEQWIAEFLAIQDMFDTVDTSSTVYKNIYQIPPSHSISLLDGRESFTRYCTFTMEKQLKLKSNEEYEEAFRSIFQTAVNSRLRTYHQVGAHLSGGLDSGSVVSFAAKALYKENKKLHTFSFVPLSDDKVWTPGSRIADESPLIKSTVNYVGNINDHYLDFRGKSSYTEINDWLEILEMPYKFFENSYWLKGIHEVAHRTGVNVLLNGRRGNNSISWGWALEYYSSLLKKMRLIHLYREVHLISKVRKIKKIKVFSSIGKNAFYSFDLNSSKKDDHIFPLMIDSDFANRTNVFEKLLEQNIDYYGNSQSIPYESTRENYFNKLHNWDKNGAVVTKLSLRSSLLERDPTNDLRVIRYCLSVPEEQFVRFGLDRSLIRRATNMYLPDNVRFNGVRGYQAAEVVPRMIPTWDLFIKDLEQLINDPDIFGYLNLKVISSALEKIKSRSKEDYSIDYELIILMRSLIFYRFIKSI
ncbi:asparagine synthase-related protein [Bacillus sp. T3]|uniref:asparagine synthase-related protein n=1 Tax=Bacillus sp. T3 TaxID=467262 RepID=UPI0029818208|nr:asparagine synthase-related protein [Bacillus sp. T3]